jgi:cell division transport system permease protein
MLSLREALVAFRRAPLLSALSVTTIAFSLFAFGLFGLVVLNIRQALDKVEERVEIRAFVDPETSTEALTLAAEQIAASPDVLSTAVVSQEDALERARRELGEFRDVFDDASFLPPSIEVRLRPGHRDPEAIGRVVKAMREFSFVEDVRYGAEWITQLHRLRNIAGVAGIVLGLAFAFVAMIVIGATIRMAVLSRSREISIMRLVGATDWFIRRPFLIEGAVKGLLGGAVALFLTWAATGLLERYLRFETVFFDSRLAMLGLAVGMILGLAGSAVSVGRHLREV